MRANDPAASYQVTAEFLAPDDLAQKQSARPQRSSYSGCGSASFFPQESAGTLSDSKPVGSTKIFKIISKSGERLSNLGDIKWIETEVLSLLESHHLNEHIPRWKISIANRVEQIANAVIRVRRWESSGLFNVKVADALSGTHVEFAVYRFTKSV